MHPAHPSIPDILAELERFHGPQTPGWPTDPYEFLVWLHSGYPSSDVNCARGWEELNRQLRGVEPGRILDAGAAKLASALKAGGMVPELRAQRLLEIAARVRNEFGGDLRSGLNGPLAAARKALKKFPNIADPGADRILLFAGIAPVAAVPSNCPHVLVRIALGRERENYGVNYREAQQLIEAATPATLEARQAAYLLLKRHGQALCKSNNPKCDACPLRTSCAFSAGKSRGRAS